MLNRTILNHSLLVKRTYFKFGKKLNTTFAAVEVGSIVTMAEEK